MKHIKLFALLALATFFASCDMLPNTAQLASGGSGDLIPVRVTLGDGNARTILPNMGEDFSKYKLVLRGEASGDNDKTAPAPVEISGEEYRRSYGNWIIALPEGEWIIHAIIQVTVGGTDYDMVTGSSFPVYVSEWNHDSVNINIHQPETDGQGTFAYSVNYPAGGSATITLAPFNGGNMGTPVINNVPVSASTNLTNQTVASGIYFLTVKATVSGKTVTRNEVVHIYRSLTSTANYVFTKLDFDPDATLKLSGTITIHVNGQQPAVAEIYCYPDGGGHTGFSAVDFTGNGTGTWEVEMRDLGGASTLNFNVTAGPFWEELNSIPIPVGDQQNINLGTVNINLTQLALDTWHDGNFEDWGEQWYAVPVTGGQAYAFSWNDRYDGDGSKTADIYVQAHNINGDSLFSADSAPVTYRANATGTIYLRVYPSGDTGTYAIKYSTTTIDVHPLSANTWAEGNFTSYNQDQWYSMQVTAGNKYFLWSNDGYQGDGSKQGYIRVEVEAPDGSFNYSQQWNSPREFTAGTTDTVYLRVAPDGNTGTYAIAYSTIPVNPAYTVTPITSGEKSWVNGDIGNNEQQWYTMNVTAGTDYYFWLNNANEGDSTKTAHAVVNVYDRNGNQVLNYVSDAWFYPQGFYAESSGTIYLSIRAYDPGTYAIAYSTEYSNWFNPLQNISATPLAANAWTNGEFNNYDESCWYSITVTPDTGHYIWLNSVYGDDSKTAGINADAYDSEGNSLASAGGAWEYPMYIYSSTNTVYLRVRCWEPGTYAIAHSASDTRP